MAARLVAALGQLAANEPIGDALRGSGAGPAAGVPIADALRSCTTAHAALDLYGCRLTDHGATPVLSMLQACARPNPDTPTLTS